MGLAHSIIAATDQEMRAIYVGHFRGKTERRAHPITGRGANLPVFDVEAFRALPRAWVMDCFIEHFYQERDLERDLIGAGYQPALPLRPHEEPAVVELLRECARYRERSDARTLLRTLDRGRHSRRTRRRLYIVDEST